MQQEQVDDMHEVCNILSAVSSNVAADLNTTIIVLQCFIIHRHRHSGQ